MSVLVTGGARSGKSSFAERWMMAHAGQAVYVATAQAFDREMEERIALHRQQRTEAAYPWETREEPLRLAELLQALRTGQADPAGAASSAEDRAPAVLVDCLTLWLSNTLLAHEGEEDMEPRLMEAINQLVDQIQAYPAPLVLVTNEVGDGIVPEYRLGRVFRDYAGILNRKVAAVSDQVFLVTAGIPIELKSREYHL
ncbi:bifunctional adenosylcobinamide kinase/adenosylcobinamide-phosphate guanylyltransferase [Paenibacillus sp. PSB04]|uniref:bifunctional adenosylcobinamide kinase/adenosylcobinamide-phosphate guanylyltransferase n=1 Tax=Paenibacillus sp. PSB04 TaxID=2866810 RepID=UPI0021F16F25|nr:bifunctional adenosylcobinamide kinase/adenosylcobinamide-phosphate guanylyltransferase [Paenibacillus sp. PSB04]UYO04726.1 bifunctional adenosylcobinamide kinase/adenosylcobinamide-phosphate guanylyltransferase [Paenibacillus sp. PSB04]